MQDERPNSFNTRRDSAQTGGHCDPFGTQNSDFMPRTYEVMRQRNCKTEKFIPFERYSSIRPPVSKCSYDETKNLLLESVDEAGCFEARSKDQDALNVWKLSPYKQSLSYYGVADGLSQPEAVKFNRTLTSSLKHASGSRKRGGRQPKVPPTPQRPPQPAPVCQPYILNRQTLGAELQAMPVVRQKLDPKTALEMVYCEKPPNPEDPLGVDEVSPKG
ncbi:uncharacterized protein LOC108091466 [Drosophila ficusphila]|uniref:uncharacterized protein LOC108091466 n=1 Tax=Drosophila ficusphila TaxID=30025 RepID=UPI001C8959C7|nr:uncharacterized protein LOC108091466 [Drosophila ficusphila]